MPAYRLVVLVTAGGLALPGSQVMGVLIHVLLVAVLAVLLLRLLITARAKSPGARNSEKAADARVLVEVVPARAKRAVNYWRK